MVFVLLLPFVVLTQVAPASYAMISDEYLENPDRNIESNETDADTTISDSASVSMGAWEYIKIFLALLFVLGLLLFVLRFLNKRNLNYQQNSMIQNLGGQSVGAQKSVQLLQIGNKLYIVGVGENVQLLQVITDPEEIEGILALYNEKLGNTTASPYIAELFNKFRAKGTAEKQPADFSELLDKRLSQIKQQRSDELESWKEKENDKT
ncbi:flagellar biosynthetic protein FliO [Lysinibacillus odysseyi]|nr:flagellar biosynthetic protein FliO [Lysinibacillus odysseyi]